MQTRKKRSAVWKPSKEEMLELINKYQSIGELLNHFGLVNRGSNYRTLATRLKNDNIDYSSLNKNIKGRSKFKPSISMELILTENSHYSRHSLKKRLIKNKLIENICDICGLLPIWNNQKLSLVLDHKNGISNDNRLENLRLLYPNCNSQTDTFAGRNKKYNS